MKLRRDITYVDINGKKYASTKADGASLEMGSSEYRERLRDLKGMDEHEQEKDKLADAGFRPKSRGLDSRQLSEMPMTRMLRILEKICFV